LLTVPIEEVARWQYIKTVLIIFPLNLQTITITLDVVKWRGGGSAHDKSNSVRQLFNGAVAVKIVELSPLPVIVRCLGYSAEENESSNITLSVGI